MMVQYLYIKKNTTRLQVVPSRYYLDIERMISIYDTPFTVVNPYPEQVLRHFLGQLSEIRELEK